MAINCHILGLGAIGGLFAARLMKAGWHCQALVRHSNATALTLQISELDGSVSRLSIPIDTGFSALDNVLITTKSQQTGAALESILARLQPTTTVLIVQNGMQGFADAHRLLPSHRVLAGTTTEGVNRPQAQHWVHAGAGFTWIGPWRQQPPLDPDCAAPWLTALQSAGLQCGYDPGIKQRLWHKLLINSVINPLTVLFDCRNGELLTRPDAQPWLERLCAEAVQVMAQQPGLQVPNDPLSEIRRVAHNTAQNVSSMLQDVRRGQATEIDAINGYLVRLAQQAGIACPAHEAVIATVKQRSSTRAM